VIFPELQIIAQAREVIKRALNEDIGRGDITTLACVPPEAQATAQIVARVAGIVAGLPIAAEVFRTVDPSVKISDQLVDGSKLDAGTVALRVMGSAQSLLTAERTVLNFVGRLSGIATLTAHCVAAVAGTGTRIVDTRKTTPGLRDLEKYAVRVGGGHNHRAALDDGILIKDNHIIASGGIRPAVESARQMAHHLLRVEVECDTIAQVHEALELGVEAILLDNMPVPRIVEAVGIIRAARLQTIIEASGGMGTDPAKLRAVAETGVDLISIGALTHSAPNLDISLEFVP
jgi:nicotinate-nucleotide pyrophosphorylase (carboxylating)